jgi:hypothetical protein
MGLDMVSLSLFLKPHKHTKQQITTPEYNHKNTHTTNTHAENTHKRERMRIIDIEDAPINAESLSRQIACLVSTTGIQLGLVVAMFCGMALLCCVASYREREKPQLHTKKD